LSLFWKGAASAAP